MGDGGTKRSRLTMRERIAAAFVALRRFGGFLKPVPCAIFVLYWFWINLGFQSTFFFSGSLADGLVPLWALPSCIALGAYVYLAACHRRLDAVFGTVRSAGAASLVLLAGIACGVSLYTEVVSVLDATVLKVASAVFVGVGTPLILMNIARIFSLMDPSVVLLQTIVGALGAAPLCALTSLLGRWHFLLLLLAVPIALYVCMVREIRRRSVQPQGATPVRPKFPSKIVVTSVVHGCALGVLFGLSDIVSTEVGNLIFLALAIALAALALAFFALVVKVNYNSLIYRGAFVVIALGAACLVVLPSMAFVGAFVQLLGFCMLHLIMWGLNCFLVHRFHVSILWLVGLATAGCMAGEVACGLAVYLLVPLVGPTALAIGSECLLMLGLMVSALFLSNAQNLRDGWSLVKPSNFRPAFGDFQALCDEMSAHYHLSEREREVFSLFARGRNRKAIADILVLSDETVKSHIQGIYRKTGAHSQQEIIDLTEVFQDA